MDRYSVFSNICKAFKKKVGIKGIIGIIERGKRGKKPFSKEG